MEVMGEENAPQGTRTPAATAVALDTRAELSEPATTAARPTDDAIVAQENAIRAEVATKVEYVGDKEHIRVLAAEYEQGSSVIKAKIENLSKRYQAVRRARGDGNCFFRSFMFLYLEHILETKDEEEATRMLGRMELCKGMLRDVGYPEFTYEDFVSVFVEQVESVRPTGTTPLSIDALVQRCRDQGISDYVVMFFRFITSAEIQLRADFFAPFILGFNDMDPIKFCRTCVEPMGEESDHIHITALTDALRVPVRVVYLDNSPSGGSDSAEVNVHDFIPGKAGTSDGVQTKEPFVAVLYRPGHYDILYV